MVKVLLIGFVRINSSQDSLDWVDPKMDSNIICDFKLKLGIWNRSQPRIDVNSQSNLYNVLTLYHTRICLTQSTNYILVINSKYSSSMLWPFHASIKKLYFSLHPLLTRVHHNKNTHTKFPISEISRFYKEVISFNW